MQTADKDAFWGMVMRRISDIKGEFLTTIRLRVKGEEGFDDELFITATCQTEHDSFDEAMLALKEGVGKLNFRGGSIEVKEMGHDNYRPILTADKHGDLQFVG